MFLDLNLVLPNDGSPFKIKIIKGTEHFLPYRFESLNIDGTKFDLRLSEDVEEGIKELNQIEKLVNEGDYLEYEGKSTETFGGGKNKLEYDKVRLKLAKDFHDGKHQLSFDQQHQEAKRIQEYSKLNWR